MATKSQENHSNGVDVDDDDDDDEFSYLFLRPEKGGLWDLFWYAVLGDIGSGVRFLESSDEGLVGEVAEEHRWGMVVTIIIRKIIALFAEPIRWTGYLLDFLLNPISHNGNLFGLLYNLIHGEVVVPQRGTETFITTMGHVDGRMDLYNGERIAEDIVASVSEETSIISEIGNPALMDLCIMASKLAYENAKVIRKMVVENWKMHFVDCYNCWNDFRKEMSTQVFILCDKPNDANLILISFRGREPLYANVWSTDFDYSWYENPKLGKLHMGFLEALGLGNRTNAVTYHNHLQVKHKRVTPANGVDVSERPSEGTKALSSNTDSDKKKDGWDQSSNSEVPTAPSNKIVPPEMVEMSAYYVVRRKLKSLLEEHKNAKFVVTGHSLGGALAILFPSVLVLHEEMKLMQKLLGVYTFGQPRVGDRQLGMHMKTHLDNPIPKYFRIVYCNNIVPRLPYDGKTLMYKHFGVCLYYDSQYIERKMEEEPISNYFGMRYLIPEYLNAVWELIRSLTMSYTYGPKCKEGWLSILTRMIGLMIPGISPHCFRDYINSVRLGKERTIRTRLPSSSHEVK